MAPVGLQPLMLGAARESYLYVPATYRAERPAPLLLLLHGAGGHARQGLDLLRSLADEAGVVLLAPTSREHTWDLLVDRRYGPDVTIVDQALEHVFSRYAVDTARIAVGGFSDGASYALSLGDHQWGPLHARAGVLARVRCSGGAGGFTADLRLPRHARRSLADRSL
jgi:phospholipase/carboxylesterase